MKNKLLDISSENRNLEDVLPWWLLAFIWMWGLGGLFIVPKLIDNILPKFGLITATTHPYWVMGFRGLQLLVPVLCVCCLIYAMRKGVDRMFSGLSIPIIIFLSMFMVRYAYGAVFFENVAFRPNNPPTFLATLRDFAHIFQNIALILFFSCGIFTSRKKLLFWVILSPFFIVCAFGLWFWHGSILQGELGYGTAWARREIFHFSQFGYVPFIPISGCLLAALSLWAYCAKRLNVWLSAILYLAGATILYFGASRAACIAHIAITLIVPIFLCYGSGRVKIKKLILLYLFLCSLNSILFFYIGHQSERHLSTRLLRVKTEISYFKLNLANMKSESMKSESAPTESAPTEEAPTEPVMAESTPAEPASTESLPVQPTPAEPVTAEPIPTKPIPTKPTFAHPAPSQLTPSEVSTMESALSEDSPTFEFEDDVEETIADSQNKLSQESASQPVNPRRYKGRFVLWADTIQKIIENPILGYGASPYKNVEGVRRYRPHCMYLEAFLQTGVLGGTFFLIIIFIGIKDAITCVKKTIEDSWLSVLLLFCIIYYAFDGVLMSNYMLWLSVVALRANAVMARKKEELACQSPVAAMDAAET